MPAAPPGAARAGASDWPRVARHVFRPDNGAWRSPQHAVPNGSVLGGEHTGAAQRLSIRDDGATETDLASEAYRVPLPRRSPMLNPTGRCRDWAGRLGQRAALTSTSMGAIAGRSEMGHAQRGAFFASSGPQGKPRWMSTELPRDQPGFSTVINLVMHSLTFSGCIGKIHVRKAYAAKENALTRVYREAGRERA